MPTGAITFPSEISGRKVTQIKGSFGEEVTKITVPGTVKVISKVGCYNLQELILQEGVAEIGNTAFYHCEGLAKVELPSTLKKIGQMAFANCKSLKSIQLPKNLESIDYHAFSSSGLTAIVVPEFVMEIEHDVFAYTPLESVTIQGTVLGSEMFKNCQKLKTVVLSNNALKELSGGLFDGCISLDQITIPASIRKINNGAFKNCVSLQKIKIPYGLKAIENYTFQNCTSLKSVYIPSTMTEIGRCAFDECKALRDVYYQASSTAWKNITVGDYNAFLLAADVHFNSPEALY